MPKLKLAETMFIAIKEPRTDNEFFDAKPRIYDLAEMDEVLEVGEYRLVRKLRLKTQPKIDVLKTKKKAGG